MTTDWQYATRYELEQPLSRKNLAEVWKAFDTQAHQYVAIEFLRLDRHADPVFTEQFQHEAKKMRLLRHPNIVQYRDFFIAQLPGTMHPAACVVMDYINSISLQNCILGVSGQRKLLPVSDVIQLFLHIGMALDYAHQQGIVHGQLRPTSIMLNQHSLTSSRIGMPVVTDFGITMSLIGMSQVPAWSSTPLYRAPEQISGFSADARSDMYSLGAMLYELCTGKPPFPGNDFSTIAIQQANTFPVSPMPMNSAIPPALKTIIMRCLAKDPMSRFSSMAALVAELSQVADQAGLPSVTPTVFAGMELAEPEAKAALQTLMSSKSITHFMSSSSASLTPSLPISESGINNTHFSPLPEFRYSPVAASGLPEPSQAPIASPTVYASGPEIFTSSSTHVPLVSSHHTIRRHGLWTVLIVALALLVVGSGFATYLFHGLFPSNSAGIASSISGQAYFVSSGLLSSDPDTALVQGITDGLEIHLEHVPQLPPGKGYYGWLLNSKNLPWLPIPLSKSPLAVNNGTLVFSYAGDARHSDLLATNSRFLITVGDIAAPPLNPDAASLVYYAGFSEVLHPFGAEKYSLYDHIRHLLANDPKVAEAGLTGGLDIWLYRNTQKILEWADSARDSALSPAPNVDFVRRQLTRIIDYLDGDSYIQLQKDLPGQPLLVNPSIARIGLLTFDASSQNPPGYLYHIEKHLHEVTNLPESTPTQKAQALQISQGLDAVDAWDHTIRNDALALLYMTDAQLTSKQAEGLLNEMATLANQALVGQVDPQDQVMLGVIQVHYAIQRLATFDIQACTPNNPCPALV